MQRKTITRYILYPVLLYAIISLEITVVKLAGFETDAVWVWAITLAFTAALLVAFTIIAKPTNLSEGLKLGAVWAAVFILLDLFIVIIPFTGLAYWADLRTLLPYPLSILIPTIYTKLKTKET